MDRTTQVEKAKQEYSGYSHDELQAELFDLGFDICNCQKKINSDAESAELCENAWQLEDKKKAIQELLVA